MNDLSIPKTQPESEYLEIERKFLVKRDLIQPILQDPSTKKIAIKQGYIAKNENGVIRIRIEDDLDTIDAPKAFLMSKIKINANDAMSNLETPPQEISLTVAERLLSVFVPNSISKVRYITYLDGKKWEVDEFMTPNPGLLLAEIELAFADEEITIPEWIDVEVTGVSKYYNANM